MSHGRRRIFSRARTALGLPGRVVAVEDHCRALETDVAERVAEMRHELAEIRALLRERLAADAEATELVGRLLARGDARLDALEDRIGPGGGSGSHPGGGSGSDASSDGGAGASAETR